MDIPLRDHLKDLRVYRSDILNNMRHFQERVADDGWNLVDGLYPLWCEYNQLTDRIQNIENDIARNTLWDPLERLPPEIWPDIIQNAIEASNRDNLYSAARTHALLRLTTVSRSWLRALTDTPVLWTTIVLNQYHENYAAMATVGFYLSKDCEVDLQLVVTPEVWPEVAPLVFPHRHRIHNMMLSSSTHSHISSILDNLPILPNLRQIQLGSALLWTSMTIPSLDITRMPSLQHVNNSFNVASDSPWYPLMEGQVMQVQTLTAVQTEAWQLARQVQRMTIIEQCGPLPSQARLSSSLPPSLTFLRYSGANVQRLLPLISLGSSITGLNLTSISLAQFGALITLAPKLSTMRSLMLGLLAPRPPTMVDTESEVMKLLNISEGSILPSSATLKSLHFQLYHSAHGSAHRSLLHVTHSVLLEAFPKVISLDLRGGTLTRTLCDHLDTQNCLKNLTMQDMDASGHLPVELLKRGQLETLDWSRYIGPQNTEPSSLYNLGAFFRRSNSNTKTSVEKMTLDTIEVIPDLLLGSGTPYASYSLPSFSKLLHHEKLYGLRALQVFGPLSQLASMHALHLVEALAYFPYDLPQLETLHLGGCILEWDVIIVMLERRNIAPPNGVSPIRYVHDMGDTPPSSIFLTVIGPLLRGRYADREPLSSYSLTRVAEYIQDKTQTGCLYCCHRFWSSCCMEIGPANIPFESLAGVEDNEFLEDPISDSTSYLRSPTPALSKSDAQWLSKIRERRAKYMDCLKKARVFGRRTACRGESYYRPRERFPV